MSREIYLDDPNVGRLEKAYTGRAIDAGYVSTFGYFVPRFEDRFAAYLGVRAACATQSGTAAIHMALHELKIRRGDEVIVPSLTFSATVNPIMYLGAKPVFVDVDTRTLNMDVDEIEKKITRRTKVILPVHLYGNPCDMDAIMSIARQHGLRVIEDTTEALGAIYKNGFAGTFAEFGCFSFNGNKIITTGGGGMVVSNSMRRIKHIRFLVNQANHPRDILSQSEMGFNYRMTNIEAALGLAQLKRLDVFLRVKKKMKDIYLQELSSVHSISFPRVIPGSRESCWMTCIIFNKGINISKLQLKLRQKGIPTRRLFRPLPQLPPYKQFSKAEFPRAVYLYEKGLCLPSSTLNTSENIYYVCRILKESLKICVG